MKWACMTVLHSANIFTRCNYLDRLLTRQWSWHHEHSSNKRCCLCCWVRIKGVHVSETTVYLYISIAVWMQQCLCVSGEVVAVLCAFTEPRPTCLPHITLQKRTDAIVCLLSLFSSSFFTASTQTLSDIRRWCHTAWSAASSSSTVASVCWLSISTGGTTTTVKQEVSATSWPFCHSPHPCSSQQLFPFGDFTCLA